MSQRASITDDQFWRRHDAAFDCLGKLQYIMFELQREYKRTDAEVLQRAKEVMAEHGFEPNED